MSATFLITAFVIVATPGTGRVVHRVGRAGPWPPGGVVAAAGCTLGIVPHLIAAITGTAALLRASGVAFETVKALGVAYLLYMAYTTWRDKRPLLTRHRQRPQSAPRVIVSAILANLLNPKLTLFFFAFLPQFVPAHSADQLHDASRSARRSWR